MMVYNPDEVEKDYEEYTGGCWKCGTQFTLKDEDTKCGNCNTVVRWWCNSCKKPFDIEDKETKKKLRECKVCGYFVCPHCKVCSTTCDKHKWEEDMMKIIKESLPDGEYPLLPTAVKEIVNYVESIKSSRERRTCPNGVPISYSKGRIKNLLLKTEGFRVRDENDRKKFIERMDEATEMPVGTEVTIDNVREKGSYGQEYRDVFNLLVCMGKFEIKWLKNKEGEDYCVFVRCDKLPCNKLARKDLIVLYCKKCKTNYTKGNLFCTKEECMFKSGSKKGMMRELKKRASVSDVCQLYRGHFKKGNGKD